MSDQERRAAARQFSADWQGRGDEKQETQSFWLALLQKVYGVAEPEKYIDFEVPVKLDHTSFIDGFIRDTRVLIEQKGRDVDLHKGASQSDGSFLTPFQQARRYAGYLPHDRNPRWIVVCNFRTFEIHDMNRPNDEPEVLRLADLEKEYPRLQFLVDTKDEHIQKEMEVSLKAGEIVGVLYDALLKQYNNSTPPPPDWQRSLNILCVRLVFCFYAEDAGVFARRQFHDYLARRRSNARQALIDLFRVLDTDQGRDPYLDEDLLAFPYVNGGLFSDESVIIPRITDGIVDLLLRQASEDFDWSGISPTIFGAVFESTLNPETRRAGGMHYTSIENIHKVIDPLFLDGLKAEFAQIEAIGLERTREARLAAFQEKLAALTFLDPACGSGNFLTETYLCLRRLENEAIAARLHGQVVLGDIENPIRVSIGQFYGIEINDFAVTVAKSALWIAESQMMRETEAIVRHDLDFLPLKTNAHIVEGNALRLDWESVVPKERLNYIMGNPPFVGARLMSEQQKGDLNGVFSGWKNAGNLDYVCCWYKKAADLMAGTAIRTALVSTNSVTQGESVADLWKPLFAQGIHIDFAHRTFRWDSEAKLKAHVHCVIVGFSIAPNPAPKIIYSSERPQIASNINGYLLDAPCIFIESRSKPLCDVPAMSLGNQPIDGGFYSFSTEEKDAFIRAEPDSAQYFRPWIGSKEFINSIPRFFLYLRECTPTELRKLPECCKRVEEVRKFRLSSKRAVTRELADTPREFAFTNISKGTFIVVPEVSSEKRRYVPMGFLTPETLCSNLVKVIPNATIYHFGILTSNIHNAWMRAVCGRLEMRYRYSNTVVYNNFPWPTPTEEQRARIERTAQAILDARALYPDASLADLYDEITMPPELRRAHQENDRAVMQAYGFSVRDTTESICVARLMEMYQDLTGK